MNSYIARLWDFFCYSNQRMDVKSVVETARLLDQ